MAVGACGLCRALRRLLRRAAHTLRVPGIRRAVRMPEYGIYHGYGLLCGNGERLFGAEPCPGASRGLMVAGILYYQSLPEIETDLAAGKRTLANILGKAKAELVFKLGGPPFGSHGEPLGLRARRVAGVSRAADVPLVLAGLPPYP